MNRAIGAPPVTWGFSLSAILPFSASHTYLPQSIERRLNLVASPGSKNTPAQKITTEPVWDEQPELKKKYRIERETYEPECRRWEADKPKARQEEKLEPKPPDEPAMGRTVVEDATVEALHSVLEANPRDVLDIEDKLSGWVRRMDQYKGGKGADRQFFLGVWSNIPVAVDRKGKGASTIIDRPWLSLLGSIQPTVIWELAARRKDGMLDRFLCFYPDTRPARLSDDDVSQETSDQVKRLYDKLSRLQWEDSGTSGTLGAPVRIRCSVDARVLHSCQNP